MEIIIQDTYKGQSQIVPFNYSQHLIGRDPCCDIVLNSPFVSREHARLLYRNKAVLLEAVGMNGTFLNNIQVREGEPVEIELADKIRIGEFVLSLARDDQQSRAKAYSTDVARKYLDLQHETHDQLLRKIDLRKMSLQDTRSREYVDQVNKTLSLLFAAYPFDLSPEVEEYVVKESFKAAFMDRLNLGDSGRYHSTLDLDPGSQEVEEQFQLLGDRMFEGMQLRSDSTERATQSLDKMERDFNRVIDRYWLDMTPGLKLYAIKRLLRKDLNDIIFGFGPLEDLLKIPNVTEIMVVSRDQIYIEKKGVLEESGRAFISDEITLSIIERILSPLGRRIDKSQPLVDARLPDGSRVNAVIPPLALKGPCITIRKFSKEPFTIDDLIEFGTLNRRSANFLKACVTGKKNIIISGGTGTGKTTLLNVISSFISSHERIVTIEDSAELQLSQRHVVSLETKPPNIEGGGSYTIRDLVKNALRMRPDRIVVGECRGGEALDMLQAMNTGHSGSMTTGHANSSQDMLLRLETMVLTAVEMPVMAIRSQIASALDIIVQLTRFPDGRRRVTQVTELVGFDEEESRIITEDIFTYDGEELIYTGVLPTFIEQLLHKNYLRLDEIF